MKRAKILTIVFKDIKLYPRDLPKLRGFLSKKFSEFTLIHNHLENGKFSYKFPQIQFRIINKSPAIISFGEGIEVIKKMFFELDEIQIEDKIHKIFEKQISLKEIDIGESTKNIKYKFISPWMGLNQENHKKYISLTSQGEKQNFLNHILRENLKTIAKGFDYFIPNIDEIIVKSSLTPQRVNFKNSLMQCFKGEFEVNFKIPDYLGLGKQSARGFGVVEKKI